MVKTKGLIVNAIARMARVRPHNLHRFIRKPEDFFPRGFIRTCESCIIAWPVSKGVGFTGRGRNKFRG